MSRPEEFITVIQSEFPEDRLTYQKAIATFHPQSAEEAAKLFKLANAQKQPLFITGFGNNIDPIGSPFTEMITVRTDRLNDVLEINPPDLYITVGSGFPLREINVELEQFDYGADEFTQARLYLPHADLPYVGSVGGAIAAGLNTTMHGHQVPLKKYLVKATVVTPEGDIITPGSVCFKSVSGYDIVKLFWNSWGLLGLIISASFRIMPATARPEFATMTLDAINRRPILAVLDEKNTTVDASYSKKIRNKFDPQGIFPIV